MCNYCTNHYQWTATVNRNWPEFGRWKNMCNFHYATKGNKEGISIKKETIDNLTYPI